MIVNQRYHFACSQCDTRAAQFYPHVSSHEPPPFHAPLGWIHLLSFWICPRHAVDLRIDGASVARRREQAGDVPEPFIFAYEDRP